MHVHIHIRVGIYIHIYIFCNSSEPYNAPVIQEVILMLVSVFNCVAETIKMDLKRGL
jgi:hypothetical protein